MKSALFASFALIAIMIGASGFGWQMIPDGEMVVRHWSADGEPNGFSPRNQMLIGLPVAALVLTILFLAVPKIDPRKEHIEQSRGILLTSWLGSLAVLAIIHVAIIYQAISRDETMPIHRILLFSVCAFLIVIGNFTAKSRSNYFLGVRTPWTLSSEHAWGVTNRIAGRLFVATGILAALAGVFAGTTQGIHVFGVGAIMAALIGVIVSYFAWRGDPEREET